MPAKFCVGPIEDNIPAGWCSLGISDLTTATSLTKKYIQLKIQHRYSHYACKVNRIKLLLEDGNGRVIEFFAFGCVSDQLKLCEKGDSLLLIKFEVDICPGQSQYKYQLIADDSGKQDCLIWVSKAKSPQRQVTLDEPLTQGSKGGQETQRDVPKLARVSTASKQVTQHISKPQESVRSYSYKKLSELKVNTVVDVYGVVKFVKPATRGRGTDYFCVIGLVDPSIAEKNLEKLTCVLFHKEPTNLPNVSEGDVLRLHRLKIQAYQSSKQGFNGAGFQWLAFHGSEHSRSASSPNYTFEEQDKIMVSELLAWWSRESETVKQPAINVVSPSKQTLTLTDARPKRYFDLVCQVVQVCLLDPDVCRLLRVWDGTKFEGPIKKVADNELNGSLELGNETIVRASKDYIVDMFLFDNHAQESNMIKPGDYILLTNVHSAVVSGLVELTVHGGGLDYGRGFEKLQRDNPLAKALTERLEPLLNVPSSCPTSSTLLHSSSSNEPGKGPQHDPSSDPQADSCAALDNPCRTQGDRATSRTPLKVCSSDQQDSHKLCHDGSSPDGDDRNEACSRADAGKPWSQRKNGQSAGVDDNGSCTYKSLKSCTETVAQLPSSDRALGHRAGRNSHPMTADVSRDEANNLCPDDMRSGENEHVDDEDSDSNSEDSSQSIFLSVYNESTFRHVGSKRKSASKSISDKSFGDSEKPGNSSEANRSALLCRIRQSFKHTEKRKSTDRLINKGKKSPYFQATDHETSSQESYKTAPSPDLHRVKVLAQETVLPEIPVSPPTNTGAESNEICRDDNRHREERQRSNTPDITRDIKRMRMTADDERQPSAELPPRPEDESEGSFDVEFDETFTQLHLEILDSDILCFETQPLQERSNSAIAGDSTNNHQPERVQSIQETEMNTERNNGSSESGESQIEQFRGVGTLCQSGEMARGNKRKRKKQNAPNSQHVPTDVHAPQQSSEQPVQGREDSSVSSKRNQLSHSQSQEEETGSSQVSSSTDSSTSTQSQPRCLLRTASVVVNHPNCQLSTLQHVLHHPPPYKFCVQARVASVQPRPAVVADLVHFFCSKCKFFRRMSMLGMGPQIPHCPQCPKPDQAPLRPMIVLVLQLSDGCDTITVSLWDKNAELFFGGITAQQLMTDPGSFPQVQQWLSDLCALGSSLEERPILECCVCSYHVDGDVKFQILDTSLV